jgi:hypothetical protein
MIVGAAGDTARGTFSGFFRGSIAQAPDQGRSSQVTQEAGVDGMGSSRLRESDQPGTEIRTPDDIGQLFTLA